LFDESLLFAGNIGAAFARGEEFEIHVSDVSFLGNRI
jgi:hypothetical protein